MTLSWQCAACLTFNDDPQSPCVACGERRRRPMEPPRPPSVTPAPATRATAKPTATPRAASTVSIGGRVPRTPSPRSYYIPAKPPPSRGLRRTLTTAVVIAGMLLAIMLVVSNQQHDNPASNNSQPDNNTVQGDGSGQDSGAGQDSGTTSDEAADEAAAERLDALLTESIAGRKHLLTAIDSALACENSAAISEMKAASSARKALIAKASGTDLAALPSGDDLKSALVGFLRASYTADEAYLRWVRSADSCPSTKAASFDAVESANSRARANKTDFLDAWNPIAELYGLPTRDVKSI